MCANRCLVWGIADEQKNVDAWDMERRTESAVPSAAIVHIERKTKESQEQARKHGVRWQQA